MKPINSEETSHSFYKTLCENTSDDDMEESEDDEEGDEDDEELENLNCNNTKVQNEIKEQNDGYSDRKDNIDGKLNAVSQNGSTTSGTLGLYSSLDNIVGGSFGERSHNITPPFYPDDSSQINDHYISSHLKGALSFGLPSKGNALRISRPYKIMKKRGRPAFSHSKKSIQKASRLLVHHPSSASKQELLKRVEKKMEREKIDHLDEDLQTAYRIVVELMAESLKSYNSIFMETIELDASINGDYLEVVKQPIWFPKIKEKLLAGEYNSITEVIGQIRLMLENTYRYFGTNHSFSRRGLRMEYILEQKLALLPSETRMQCSIEVTNGINNDTVKEATRTKSTSITVNGESYFSHLMYNVRGCRQAREKELKKKRVDLMRQAKISKEIEVVQWEERLTTGPLGGPIKHMWELVQINQFLSLSMNVLNLTQVSQYELERILMIPEASMTLRSIMTALVLSRQQRAKLGEKPHMPYSVWARRLANKTFHWYRVYSKESRDEDKIFDQLGIEPKFWSVCGPKSPFHTSLFHEMPLYQRVWLLKTLCDYIAHTHKSVQEAIAEQPEDKLREQILGCDRKGAEYIHFSQLIGLDVRIYRRLKPSYPIFEGRPEDGEKPATGSAFSKDQIKSFQKLIRKLKKNREKDEDWEEEQRRRHCRVPKKRGRKPRSLTPSISTTPEKRTRPQRLRQTPKPRYDLLTLQSCLEEEADLDDDIENYSSLWRNRWIERDSEGEDTEESDIEEAKNEKEEFEEVCRKGKVGRPRKNSRKGRGGSVCKTCGKTFSSRFAMLGHSAMHTKALAEEKTEGLDGKEEQDKSANLVKSKLMQEDLKLTCKLENEFHRKLKDEEQVDIKNIEEEMSLKPKPDGDFSMQTDSAFSQNPPTEMVLKKLKMEGNDKHEAVEDRTIDLNADIKDFHSDDEIKMSDRTPKFECSSSETRMNGHVSPQEGTIKKTEGNEKASDELSRSVSPSDENDSSLGIPLEPELKSKHLPVEPDTCEFELVVTTFAELRSLILKFGSLPPKYVKEKVTEEGDELVLEDEAEKEENESTEGSDDSQSMEEIKTAESDKEAEKVPRCEEKLHRSLCNLLIQLAPFETKMNVMQRQTRKKLWNEYLDWSRQDSSFVDPAEEAWNSDHDPDPVPSATQTPKQSSSSSSSEDTYYDDGSRKRKLRKRRGKRFATDPPSPAITPDPRAPTPPIILPEEDTIAVSSRGRVRKVKKIVNYDRLDFDKLAQQAKEEALAERERKKRRKEEESSKEASQERVLQEAARSLHIPSSGVRRYIISKEGEVVGYIGNDGQVHSDSLKATKASSPPKEVSKVAPTVAPKEDTIPKVLVSTVNESGNHVYVRIVGTQALELMRLIEASKNDPPRQVKLQKLNQTYTFNTNSYVMTQNIPGYPNCDTSDPSFLSTLPTSLSSKPATPSPIKVTQKKVIHPTFQSNPLTSQSNPISTPAICKAPNSVTQAYQGLSSPTTSQPKITLPTTSSCASLSASTRLVFASPSTVPSVAPMSSGGKPPPSSDQISTRNPLIVQNDNGPQIQIALNSDRLSQIVQKTGQRVVAVPNEKGGYTISLLSAVNSPGSNVSKSPQVIAANTQVIRGSSQKSVITQLLPTLVNTGTGTQPVGVIKGHRLPQPAASVVQSQPQVLPQYTVASQVVNSSSPLGRQVLIQQPVAGPSAATVMTTVATQPHQQVVHIAQTPVVQQQQSTQPHQQILHIQQQTPQKMVQVVHTSGGRQLLQMLQPGQVLVSGNTVPSSVSAIQQPGAGVMVHTSQGIPLKPTLIQPQQVVIQQPQQQQQPSKIIQLAHPDQFVASQQTRQNHTIHFPQEQTQSQQVVIQPQQQHYILHQRDPNQTTLITKPATVQSQSGQIQQVPQIHSQVQQPPSQPQLPAQVQIAHPLEHSSSPQVTTHTTKAQMNSQIRESPQGQQPCTPLKDGTVKQQVGRLGMLQMNEGQKVYLQFPDGRMSMLSPEQLQPLLSSGALKLSL